MTTPEQVFTIGHSTRPFAELVALLRQSGIETLADIRTIPRSRRHPQFEKDALARGLPVVGIRYVHLPGLGGFRRGLDEDSPNKAWRNASFRAYADHMLTPAFEADLAELRSLAAEGPLAVMCAESVPWRCHRSLLADALVARGVRVEHVIGPSAPQPHRITPFAHVVGERVTYPLPPLALPLYAVNAPAREPRSRSRR
jgi:uncharacterized protein (DUF488 family)